MEKCEKHGMVYRPEKGCPQCFFDPAYAPQQKSALDHQEGGSHYKNKAIQPVEYCMANGIGFMEGSVIKYVTRWRDKGGVQDLKKARHFLDLLIEHEERK